LIAIFGAALERGLGNMQRKCEKSLKSGSKKLASEAGREGAASYNGVLKCLYASKQTL